MAVKYQSGLYNDRCRVLFFQINPLLIFWCCLLGNVRSASPGDAFYFRPRSVTFPGRHRLSFFFFSNQYRRIMIFCRGGLMFSWQSKWEHAGVGRKTTSVELARKNLADLHWKFYRRHPKQQNILYRKEILTASVCKRNCAMSAEKYQSRLFNYRCRLLFFLFNPWIILGWYLLGNVRPESSGHASFSDLGRSSFLADVG